MTENAMFSPEVKQLIDAFMKVAQEAYTKAGIIPAPQTLADTAINMYMQLLIGMFKSNNEKTDTAGLDIRNLLNGVFEK